MTSNTAPAHNLYCFVDESGEPGPHITNNRYFIASIVVFQSKTEVSNCDKAIDNLRKVLGKPANFEFHFVHNSMKIRESFINLISKYDYTFATVAIEKASKANLANPTYMAKELVKCLPATNEKIFVLLDKNKLLYAEFKKELKNRYKKYRCAQANSASVNCLQIADYITSISKNELLSKGKTKNFYKKISKKCTRLKVI